MNKYSIAIPNTKAPSYKAVTLLILIINFLVFAYLIYVVNTSAYKALCFIGMMINMLAIAALLFEKKNKLLQSFRVEIIFIISAFIWAFTAKYLIAILLFIFAIAGLFTNRKLTVLFYDKGILYPSVPAKLFLWQEIAQVILKDDILTIDLKNNRLMQFNLDNEVAAEINAEEFNEYCRERVMFIR